MSSVNVHIFQFLFSVISYNLRLDKGTETGHIATIHSYLRQQGDETSNGTETVHYSLSTSNKVMCTILFVVLIV